jgi:hypothetical protein
VTVQLPSPGHAVALAVLACLLLCPSTALASPDTLLRGTQDLLAGPADIILSPVTGGMATVSQFREDGAHWPLWIAGGPAGFIWLTGVNLTGGALRTIAGSLELIAGLGVFFLDDDPEPAMPITERAPALLDIERPRIRIGLNYAEAPGSTE